MRPPRNPFPLAALLAIIAPAVVAPALVAQEPGAGTPAPADRTAEPAAAGGGEDVDPFASDRALLASGTEAERALAIDRLLGSGDAAVIPILAGALGDENRDLRARITLGLLRSFPAESPALFLGLLDAAELPRREAALFAIGMIDHPESIPRLVAALSAPEEVLREAAARSLSTVGRPPYNGAYARAIGEPRPIDPAEGRRLAEVRAAVIADIAANGLDALRRPLLDRYADREAARSLRAAHRAANPEDPAAAWIERIAARVERWTPRSALPDGVRLAYTITIENLVAKSSKSVPITVTAADFPALHYQRYPLDRALHLQLPIDELLLHPARCEPRLAVPAGGDAPPVDGSGDPITIRYRLPPRTDLRCGVGILNIAYWEGTTYDGRDAELVIDPASGLPTSERVTGEGGEPVFLVRYSEWLDLGEGATAPGRIEVEMPAAKIGAQVLPMRYELRFRVHDGVWLLDGAEAHARPPTGEEMRALAVVTDVAVTRGGAADAPPAPPGDGGDPPAPPPGAGGSAAGGGAGAPPGGGPREGGASTGDPGGQGSRGGSPRS